MKGTSLKEKDKKEMETRKENMEMVISRYNLDILANNLELIIGWTRRLKVNAENDKVNLVRMSSKYILEELNLTLEMIDELLSDNGFEENESRENIRSMFVKEVSK